VLELKGKYRCFIWGHRNNLEITDTRKKITVKRCSECGRIKYKRWG